MVDLDFEIKRMRLCAGDVVVLKVATPIEMRMAERLREEVVGVLPPGLDCKVMILCNGLELSVLSPEQIAALAA